MAPMSVFTRKFEGLPYSHFNRVDYSLNCVKGGGACHLREKVLAEAATTFVSRLPFYDILNSVSPCRFILVADHRKNVQYLGTNVRP